MNQPEGFISSGSEQKVHKLQRSIYGLKYASRSWNIRFNERIKTFDFHMNLDEPYVYKKVSGSAITFLVLYVDDILLIGNNIGLLQSTRTWLSKQYSMKDLGDASFIIGIKIYRDRSRSLHLSQGKYIRDLLKRAQMVDAKGCPTPMVASLQLSKYTGDSNVDGTLYRSLVSGLQYVTITRPDISFSVNKVSQYMSNLLDTYWKTVKCILRYLAGTQDHGLTFTSSNHLNLTAFSDSDWAADIDDRRSTSGFCVYLCSNLVSWSSKKQHTVSKSNTKAEYQSLAQATSEVIWLSSLLHELRVQFTNFQLFRCDNTSAIAITQNPVLHSRTKHIDVEISLYKRSC
ncbi:hypothetical protein DH2020_044755 [Rehmannia glutinosa]|uniref:Reverse transcriptase Ty1/copia-type domain-containing protein n=1 Tax=Rehmannia glutinosa TaxID=99300 RepID=A0ABR0UGS8_REHGL